MAAYQIGIDEVGAAAWAGPMGMAGVVINRWGMERKPRDCKSFSSHSARVTYLKRALDTSDFDYVFVLIPPAFIDRAGMTEARRLGVFFITTSFMEGLGYDDNDIETIIDGKYNFGANKHLIKGDTKLLNISFASVIAKVLRDRVMMTVFDEDHDYWLWKSNKGYYSKSHLERVKQYGLTDWHRRRWRINVDAHESDIKVGNADDVVIVMGKDVLEDVDKFNKKIAYKRYKVNFIM